MKTNERIFELLKTRGALTAKELANELNLTTMAIRQHMLSMEADGSIYFEDKKAPRGRPTRFWSLTKKTDKQFGDRHSELTIQLIDSVQEIFGENGLNQLIADREKKSEQQYARAIKPHQKLKDKLMAIADIRTKEGYMANVSEENNINDEANVYWLIENHCPICAAATKCQNFCRSELNLFQSLLAGSATISREEHIIEGARRCAYKIVAL